MPDPRDAHAAQPARDAHAAQSPRDADDVQFLRRAIELATLSPERDPNPRVGAVVVRDGRVVGEGWHRGAGTPHAEVEALAAAGEQAVGATAYVSLEPCAHTGRTGPCTQALLDAGIARVVYAQPDPNPLAAGGAQVLTRAGIAATGGPGEVDPTLVLAAEDLNRVWSTAIRLGRPMVTWKVAATLDGFTAAADGSSQWITGGAARADSHRLRAQADAIMVGTGTALADDPRLTVRDAAGQLLPDQPLRVVVGNRDLPPGARVFSEEAATLLLPRQDPQQVLADLANRGVRHVWLEGGATLAGAFLAAGLVDVVVCYLAPRVLGAGRPMLDGLGITTLQEAIDMAVVDTEQVGDDVRITLAAPSKEV